MNKDNEEQSKNNDKNQEQEAPEKNSGDQEASDQAPEITEAQSEKQVSEVQPPVKDTVHAQKGKVSKPKIATDESDENEFVEKVVAINRITKVTKGGKKLSFSALVVAGIFPPLLIFLDTLFSRVDIPNKTFPTLSSTS